MKLSQRYQVFGSGNGKYQVEIPDSGQKYVVDLKEAKCDCGDFREYRAACMHVIAACKYAAEDPLEYVDQIFMTDALKKMYSHFLVPISIENLTIDKTISPPIVKRQRGRPKTKRIRKGAWSRKSIHCSLCGILRDHNKRRCPNRPMVNGWQQRAQDRYDILLSESSDSNSSSSDESYSEDSIDQ